MMRADFSRRYDEMDNFSSLFLALSKIIHAYSLYVFLAMVLTLMMVILVDRMKKPNHQA
jgi:hypothetical protein